MYADFPPIDWAELEIDVRGRTSGEVKTLCPRCSRNRKKQTEPCLNVNLDKNTFNCKNCGWAGPEPGYATERGLTGEGRGSGRSPRLPPRDREKKKVYTRPKPIEPK